VTADDDIDEINKAAVFEGLQWDLIE